MPQLLDELQDVPDPGSARHKLKKFQLFRNRIEKTIEQREGLDTKRHDREHNGIQEGDEGSLAANGLQNIHTDS